MAEILDFAGNVIVIADPLPEKPTGGGDIPPPTSELVLADGSVLWLDVGHIAGPGTYVVGTKSGNPWHDPRTGKFADGPPGYKILRGAELLKNLPNESKHLIDAQNVQKPGDAITADPLPNGDVHIGILSGTSVVNQFDVPSLQSHRETGGLSVPSDELARRETAVKDAARTLHDITADGIRQFLQGRTRRDLTQAEITQFHDDVVKERQSGHATPVLPQLSHEQRAITHPSMQAHISRIEEIARKVTQEDANAPDAQETLAEAHDVLAAVSSEKQRVLDLIRQGLPTSLDRLTARALPGSQDQAVIGAHLDQAHWTAAFDSPEGTRARVRGLIQSYVDGSGREHVFNGSVSWNEVTSPYGSADWNGAIGFHPSVMDDLATGELQINGGHLGVSGWQAQSVLFHEAHHQIVHPDVKSTLRLGYVRGDELTTFIEEGLTEHQGRHAAYKAIKAQHGDLRFMGESHPLDPGAFEDLYAYQHEFSWAARVHDDLSHAIEDVHGISKPEADQIALGLMKEVHWSSGDSHDRLKMLDSHFSDLGADFTPHLAALPGVDKHDTASWSSNKPRHVPALAVPGPGGNLATALSPHEFADAGSAHEQLAPHYSAHWLPHLSADQIDSLWEYKTSSDEINGRLRGKPLEFELMSADERSHLVTQLDDALSGSRLPIDVVAWRGFSHEGLGGEDWQLWLDEHGHHFTDNGYVSTSLSPAIGYGFAHMGGYGENPVVFRIEVPKDTRGAYMDHLPDPAGGVADMKEAEILMPRGTTFEVVQHLGKDERGVRAFVVRPVNQTSSVTELAQLLGHGQGDHELMVDWPAKFSQKWLENNVNGLTKEELQSLVYKLYDRGWTDQEIKDRVYLPRVEAFAKKYDGEVSKANFLASGDFVIDPKGDWYRITSTTNWSAKGVGVDGKQGWFGASNLVAHVLEPPADVKAKLEPDAPPHAPTPTEQQPPIAHIPGQPTLVGAVKNGDWIEVPSTSDPTVSELAKVQLKGPSQAKVLYEQGGVGFLKNNEQVIYALPPGSIRRDEALGPSLTYLEPAGGTTGPSWYTDSNGSKWLVKEGQTPDHIASEALANAVYKSVGVPVADMVRTTINGKDVIASRFIQGHKLGASDSPERVKAHPGFMADALVGNWDAAGVGPEDPFANMHIEDSTGTLYRIDNGGSFEFRGMGGHKDYGHEPQEVTTLIDPSINPKNAQVMKGLTEADKAAQAKKIAEQLTDEHIDNAVNSAGFQDTQMKERVRAALKARRDWMKEYADSHSAQPPEVQHGASTLESATLSKEQGSVVTKELKDLGMNQKFSVLGHDYEVVSPAGGTSAAIGVKNLQSNSIEWIHEGTTPVDVKMGPSSEAPNFEVPTHEQVVGNKYLANELQTGSFVDVVNSVVKGVIIKKEGGHVYVMDSNGATSGWPEDQPFVLTQSKDAVLLKAGSMNDSWDMKNMKTGDRFFETGGANTIWVVTAKNKDGGVTAQGVGGNEHGLEKVWPKGSFLLKAFSTSDKSQVPDVLQKDLAAVKPKVVPLEEQTVKLTQVHVGSHVDYHGKKYQVMGTSGEHAIELQTESGETHFLHHGSEVIVTDTTEHLGAKTMAQMLPQNVTLPGKMSQNWIESNVPQMTPQQYANFVKALKGRGWTDAEISERVKPFFQHVGPSSKMPQFLHTPDGSIEFTSTSAGDSWMRQHLGGFKSRVSAAGLDWYEVRNAFQSYFGSGYGNINSALRADSSSKKGDVMKEAFEQAAQRTPQSITVYRGTSWPIPHAPTEGMVGNMIRDKGFVSTSYMASSANWGHRAKIIIPEGTPIVYALDDQMSPHVSEREILLPANSIFEIVGLEETGSSGKKMMVLVWRGTSNELATGRTLYGAEDLWI
jgi:hypothetical protein